MKLPDSIRWKSTGKTLGQGGQVGAVFVVTDTKGEFAGEYAFKGIAPGRPPKVYERFAREIVAIKAVDHPHIVRILDHSVAGDGFQFYVMQLIDGAIPLKKLLNTPDNPFTANSAKSLKFFRQLVSAIDACEQVGIVHRDLSPANVLVLPNNDIVVIDFGCCQIDDSERVTLTDEGVGTQNYMAPECESGAEENIKSTADLYSAGKLLWSAITNRFAFAREKPVFDSMSMKEKFPNDPTAWHLHHIFAATIRHEPNDRILKASAVSELADRVELLIKSGRPPLDQFAANPRCPSCGWGRLVHMPDGWQLFHNPMPPGYQGCRCDYCGLTFALNRNTLKASLDQMHGLT